MGVLADVVADRSFGAEGAEKGLEEVQEGITPQGKALSSPA